MPGEDKEKLYFRRMYFFLQIEYIFYCPKYCEASSPTLIGIQWFIRQSTALKRELQAIVSCYSHTWPDTEVFRQADIDSYTLKTTKLCHIHTRYSVTVCCQDNLCKDAKKGRYFKRREVFTIDSHFGQSK